MKKNSFHESQHNCKVYTLGAKVEKEMFWTNNGTLLWVDNKTNYFF